MSLNPLIKHGAEVCPRCNGKGRVIDEERTGTAFRKERRRLGLKLKHVAEVANVSVQYLSDLERGMRPWNTKTAQLLQAAIESLRP